MARGGPAGPALTAPAYSPLRHGGRQRPPWLCATLRPPLPAVPAVGLPCATVPRPTPTPLGPLAAPARVRGLSPLFSRISGQTKFAFGFGLDPSRLGLGKPFSVLDWRLSVLDVIRRLRAGPDTSAALREALAEVAAAMPRAEQQLRDATAKRTALLMTGTIREIRDAEDALHNAGIELDRLETAQTDLTRRLAEAEAAEAKAALDRERSTADTVAQKLADTLQRRYDDAAAAIVALLDEVANADAAVEAVNSRLLDARRSDFLQPVEARQTWLAPGWPHQPTSIRALTSLRASRRQPGYGAGRAGIEKLGRKP